MTSSAGAVVFVVTGDIYTELPGHYDTLIYFCTFVLLYYFCTNFCGIATTQNHICKCDYPAHSAVSCHAAILHTYHYTVHVTSPLQPALTPPDPLHYPPTHSRRR